VGGNGKKGENKGAIDPVSVKSEKRTTLQDQKRVEKSRSSGLKQWGVGGIPNAEWGESGSRLKKKS